MKIYTPRKYRHPWPVVIIGIPFACKQLMTHTHSDAYDTQVDLVSLQNMSGACSRMEVEIQVVEIICIYATSTPLPTSLFLFPSLITNDNNKKRNSNKIAWLTIGSQLFYVVSFSTQPTDPFSNPGAYERREGASNYHALVQWSHPQPNLAPPNARAPYKVAACLRLLR